MLIRGLHLGGLLGERNKTSLGSKVIIGNPNFAHRSETGTAYEEKDSPKKGGLRYCLSLKEYWETLVRED